MLGHETLTSFEARGSQGREAFRNHSATGTPLRTQSKRSGRRASRSQRAVLRWLPPLASWLETEIGGLTRPVDAGNAIAAGIDPTECW